MRDKAAVPVAGEIDAWCTRCKRDLNHIVVSKVEGVVKRVQCLTCQGQHAYRAAAGAAKPAAVTPRRRAASRTVVIDEHMPARDYQMSGTFREGELLLHPTYGRGKVTGVRGNKVDVHFLGGPRTLAHEPRK